MTDNFEVNYQIFSEAIERIVDRINLRPRRYDLIIAPARGGLVPATFLSHALGVPIWPILWSTRDFIRREPIPQNLIDFIKNNADVLIVEDIIDSGKTIDELIVAFNQHLRYSRVNIDTACIVFNPDQNVHKATYHGVELPGGSTYKYTDFFWEKQLNV